jgi:ribonuclease HII
MKQALEQFTHPPDYILTDAVHIPGVSIPQRGIIKGDRDVLIIACASVVAKVTRDRIMVEFDLTYPEYGFCEHKGYGTRRHLECRRGTAPRPYTASPTRR